MLNQRALLFDISVNRQRGAVVVAVLLLSAAAAIWPTPLLLLPIVAVVGAFILLYEIQLGLPLLIAAALVIPISIGTGSESSINAPMVIIAALVGLWLLTVITHQPRQPWIVTPVMLPLGVLLAVALLSFFVGRIEFFTGYVTAPLTAQIGAIGLIVMSAVTFFWVQQFVREQRWIEWGVWLYILLAGFYVVTVTVPGLWRYGLFYPRALVAGSQFWMWLIVLSTSQALFNNKLARPLRILLLALTALTFFYLIRYIGAWYSGWFPAAIAVLAMLALYRPQIGLVSAIVGLIPAFGLILRFISADAYSYSTRVEAWALVWELARANPVFGLGPANYYWYTPLVPIRGYAVVFNSHSQYVDLIAQHGIIGLVAFIWFFIALFVVGQRILHRLPEGFARAYVYGTLGAIVGLLVASALGDWVLPFVYNIGFRGFPATILCWIFLPCMIVLGEIYPSLSKSLLSEVRATVAQDQ